MWTAGLTYILGMSDYDRILAALPYDELAAQLGADPQDVVAAAQAALPALLGGLQANAADPAGASSLLDALDQHDNSLGSLEDGSTVSLSQVNTADGAKISAHVFGDQQDQVVQALGGLNGVSGDLVKRLIPILAPIVLSYLAKQLQGKNSSGGVLSSILEQVLSGAAQGAGSSSRSSAGSIIGDILSGMLGRGRR